MFSGELGGVLGGGSDGHLATDHGRGSNIKIHEHIYCQLPQSLRHVLYGKSRNRQHTHTHTLVFSVCNSLIWQQMLLTKCCGRFAFLFFFFVLFVCSSHTFLFPLPFCLPFIRFCAFASFFCEHTHTAKLIN